VAASCEQSPAVSVTVDAERVWGLQALLDPEAAPLEPGAELPPLWHWVALPRWGDPAMTGSDGHPQRPGPLADRTGTRRMFAGGEVTISRPLRLGDQVRVEAGLTDVASKSGRAGDFVLATFTTRVTNADGDVALRERQDVVYTDPRPAADGEQVHEGALPVVGRPLRPRADGGADLLTDPTVLLRFSALTANAHRIHYDLGYAQQVERLPGLLVHGPLINLALLQAARAAGPGDSVRRITHRSLSPLFCGQPARVSAHEEGPGVVSAQITGPGDQRTAVKGRLTAEFDTRESA
jgi:3-methylfumaryl-CoA hydratase